MLQSSSTSKSKCKSSLVNSWLVLVNLTWAAIRRYLVGFDDVDSKSVIVSWSSSHICYLSILTKIGCDTKLIVSCHVVILGNIFPSHSYTFLYASFTLFPIGE